MARNPIPYLDGPEVFAAGQKSGWFIRKLGECVPVRIIKGSANRKPVDARGYRWIVVYPNSGARVRYSVIHNPDKTSHGPGKTTVPVDVIAEIEVKGNFYLVQALNGSVWIHLVA